MVAPQNQPRRVSPAGTVTSVKVPLRLFLYRRLVVTGGAPSHRVPVSTRISSQPSLSPRRGGPGRDVASTRSLRYPGRCLAARARADGPPRSERQSPRQGSGAALPGTCGTSATNMLPCSTPMVDTGVFNSTSYRNGTQYMGRIDKYFGKDRIYGTIYKTRLDSGGGAVRPAFLATNCPRTTPHTRAPAYGRRGCGSVPRKAARPHLPHVLRRCDAGSSVRTGHE